MPGEVVSSNLRAEQSMEDVHVMNDYGTETILGLPISDVANRQTRINAAIAALTAQETALETWATQTGTDISALKTAGLAKKAKAKEGTL